MEPPTIEQQIEEILKHYEYDLSTIPNDMPELYRVLCNIQLRDSCVDRLADLFRKETL